jgi:hypothetical protein
MAWCASWKRCAAAIRVLRKKAKAFAERSSVGRYFSNDVNQRPNAASEDDDPEPIAVGTPANEMNDGDGLEKKAV